VLAHAVSQVSDVMLATSIGETMNTTVNVTSQNAMRGTVLVTVETPCTKGQWCTAGLVVNCSKGSYNPLADQTFATACIVCPVHSDTLYEKSTAESDCLCAPGFYDANMSATVECIECPIGTDCGSGSTLHSLPLLRGYYRLSIDTIDVRLCPDSHSSSGCVGGVGNPCAAGLGGPYCLTCSNSSTADGERVYYQRATRDVIATCKACGGTVGNTAIVAVGVVAAFALLLQLFHCVRRRLSPTTIKRLIYVNGSFTPRNKLKILLTFYQISTKVPIVFEVSFPADVKALLEFFSVAISFGLDGIAITPLECIGLSGYVPRLLFWMILPPVIMLAVLAVLALRGRLNSSRRAAANSNAAQEPGRENALHESEPFPFHLAKEQEEQSSSSLFEKALPEILLLLFLLYPLVTNAAFEGFPCYEFEGGRAWLRADVGIECNTDEHTSAQLLAWTAVVLYPIGVSVFCFVLLFKASDAIVTGKQTRLSTATTLLWKEYSRMTFWWELMELLRKFLLVGLFVVIEPGTILQTVMGTTVSATYLVCQGPAEQMD
jgi:hypothetical protein